MALINKKNDMKVDLVMWTKNGAATLPQVLKRIDDYVTVGVNMFELKFIYRDMAHFFSQLKLFAKDVLPSLR